MVACEQVACLAGVWKERKGGFGREWNARGAQGRREREKDKLPPLPPRAPPRVSLAPKTPFPFPYQPLPRRLASKLSIRGRSWEVTREQHAKEDARVRGVPARLASLATQTKELSCGLKSGNNKLTLTFYCGVRAKPWACKKDPFCCLEGLMA